MELLLSIKSISKGKGKEMAENRNEAREILAKKKWMSFVKHDNREVWVLSDGSYDCTSFDIFDPEFNTTDIEIALNYLYPN